MHIIIPDNNVIVIQTVKDQKCLHSLKNTLIILIHLKWLDTKSPMNNLYNFDNLWTMQYTGT